jgi:uncharacterized protein (TIGR00369 family)
MEIPPKSFTEMKAEILETKPGELMRVRFPFDARFTNPLGAQQGGYIATAIDNVFGQLSYFTAEGPTVTLDLNTRFIRPFLPKDGSITVEAKVVSRTKQLITMHAEILNPEGKLIALSSSQSMILSDEQKQRFSKS